MAIIGVNGIKVVVLSNNYRGSVDYVLREFKLDEIFDYTLKQLNLKAEECLFVDDKKRNTDAAKELGFNVTGL